MRGFVFLVEGTPTGFGTDQAYIEATNMQPLWDCGQLMPRMQSRKDSTFVALLDIGMIFI